MPGTRRGTRGPAAFLSFLLPPIDRDGRLLFGSMALRSFANGFVSVLLGLYLQHLGYGAVRVGAVLTAALAGGAALTFLVSLLADSLGRRRALTVLGLLSAGGGLVFALAPSYALLVGAAALSSLSPTGKDRGAFLSLEQAALPQTTSPQRRTTLFASYNVVGALASALGALCSATPSLLQHTLGMDALVSFKVMFVVYAAMAAAATLFYARLSPRLELPGVRPFRGVPWPHSSQGLIVRLAALFSLDSFAGGFTIQSFLAYWLAARWDLGLAALAGVFTAAGVLNTLSFPVAAWLSGRVGLINTMVFTHIPSNLFLMAVPLAPTPWLAVAFLLARESLSQMDVPTRQSYIMAMVPPSERTAASGFTSLARLAAQSAGPYAAGRLVQGAALGTPFFLAGGLKVAYDLMLFAAFRNRPAPEEVARREQATGARAGVTTTAPVLPGSDPDTGEPTSRSG